MKGKFLVVEGIDGCGKSTQIKRLADWLPKSGLMPKGTILNLTREPGGTALGIELRQLLLNPPNQITPKKLTELLLYASDRAQHVSEIILPAITKGEWVLSDRFSGSTLAYQGFGRKLNIEIINTLEEIATQGLVPDMTLWLDIPVKESLLRRANINNDRIENEGEMFLKNVSEGFAEIAKKENWIRIKADLDQDSVTEQIQNAMENNFHAAKKTFI